MHTRASNKPAQSSSSSCFGVGRESGRAMLGCLGVHEMMVTLRREDPNEACLYCRQSISHVARDNTVLRIVYVVQRGRVVAPLARVKAQH